MARHPRAPRAVLFDWGHTLTEYIGDDADKAIEYASDNVLHKQRQTVTRQLKRAVRNFWSTPDAAETQNFNGIVREVLDAAGFVDRELANRYTQVYLDHLGSLIRHHPEAKPLLAELDAREVPAGLICNTLWPSEWHDRLLERDQLLDLFTARVYSSDVGVRKPNRKIFDLACRELGVEDTQMVYLVGDRMDQDVQGGHDAGLVTVWLRNTQDTSKSMDAPDHTINGLCELLDLIDAPKGVRAK